MAGLEAFDFPSDNILEADDEDQNERQMLDHIQIKINGLHIRFEEDYFNADKPYSMGIIADQLNVSTSPAGREIWQFPEFLKNVFNQKPAGGDKVFKDFQLKNCRFYVNNLSEIYIPMQMYE